MRRDRAALALLVPLTLGLFEPLLCIIHCQIWLPLALHGYFAAQHEHHHHNHMASVAPAAPLRSDAAGIGSAPLPGHNWCFLDGSHGNASQFPGSPPSPVHDMIPVIPLLFGVVLLVSATRTAPSLGPPGVFISPPLRPPIPIAG